MNNDSSEDESSQGYRMKIEKKATLISISSLSRHKHVSTCYIERRKNNSEIR